MRCMSLLVVAAMAAWLGTGPGTVAFSATPAPATVLTEQGYGPLRIGMTWAQARRAMPGLRGNFELGESCFVAEVAALPGFYAMFEDRRLTSISAGEGSRIATAGGLRVGHTAAQVRAVYGARTRSEQHHYEAAPAQYLTVWTVPGRRGIRFETNDHRRITVIHAGGPSIEYVEGCA